MLSPVQRVDIVGVPMDLGASRRGVDMGPYAVRYAKLHDALGKLGIAAIVDRGNLHVPIRESAESEDASAKFLSVITSVCDDLARHVEQAVREGGLPIVLGGDHSIAVGTLDGLTRARGELRDSSGSTRTPISTARGVPRPETFTACRSISRCKKDLRKPAGPCRSVCATSIKWKRRCCASPACRRLP